ncbi:MAG TPA: SRPBCC family protein [Acidimicrobiia bacterium]
MAIDVAVPLDRAFSVFTEQFDRIKPRHHNLLAVDIAETVLEAEPGGRVYDRGVDGSICVFARVKVVEPPHRLVLAWLISPRWQIEDREDRVSEVEVRFSAIDDDHTHVELRHSGLARHGAGWESAASALSGEEGWPLYLHRFGQLGGT